MADLRIVDAPLLSTVKGTEKIPTGGEGNFSISVNQVADFAKLKWFLATEGYVDNAVGNVQADLNLHKNNESNPHNVTKTQVGLGNVDNTADLDKPVSNATQSAIITANSGKADKSYVDSQDQLKADKTTVESSLLLKADKVDLKASKISSDSNQTQQEINDFGGAKWHNKFGGYDLGATVVLANGDIVQSTVANNIVDPNVGMTGWVKTNSASQIFDESGLSQQHVNNILLRNNVVNFAAMWVSSTSVNCRAVLQAAIDLTPDGGALVIPFDIYFEGSIVCKNKNINIYNYGKIYWEPSGTGTAFKFSRDDYIDIPATELSILPKKGDYKLSFTTPPILITQPSDYFVNLISTENEIFRLQFGMHYQKHHTNAIAASDYQLRGEVITDFNDASKLKLRFVKKGTPVDHVGLHIIPTIKLETGSLNYVEYLHASNVTRKNWMLYSSNNQRSGQQVAHNHCYNINVDSCHIYGANATDSDNYSEVQFNSAWMSFKNCGYFDADGTDKRSRGLVGRHGYMISVDSCLWRGVDDHWGHEYTLKNMVLISGLGLSGGGAYLDNITAMEVLFSGRNDTPYNDGKLTTRNCKTYGKVIGSQRITTAGETSRYKLFDIIDIECDVYTSKSNVTELITTTDASDTDESFHNTQAKINLRVYQDSNKIIPIWVQGYNPVNPTLDGNRDEARLFKKLEINVEHIINDVGAYQSDRQLFYGVCADEVSIRCVGGFSASQLRANTLKMRDTDIGFNGSISTGVLKVNKMSVSRCKINNHAQEFTHGTFTPKIHLRNNEFANWSKFNSFAWDNIQTAYGNYTLIDTDRSTVSVNRNYHSYDKSKQTRHVFTSDVVISGNGTSVEYTVNMSAYSPTDLVLASLDFWTYGVYVEQIDQGNTNGTLRFRLRNLTPTDITVASGRSVTLKIV